MKDLSPNDAAPAADEPLTPVASILHEARSLVPDLLALLEARTGGSQLVAIAALDMASAGLFRAAEHAMADTPEDLARFRSDVALVRTVFALFCEAAL